MKEQKLLSKFMLIVVLTLLAAWAIYPPGERLKGGIDLVGGSSLLFEIDTAGLQDWQRTDLSERVMSILKERIDPKGQRNLEWRPIGNNRLEVRMPRPPKEAAERREAYDKARRALQDANVTRGDVASALSLSGEARTAALAGLIRGVPERKALLEAVVEKYEARLAAAQSGDADQLAAADTAYGAAVEALMKTNINLEQLARTLELDSKTEKERRLALLRAEHPALQGLIEALVAADEEWSKNRGFLEGPSDLMRLMRSSGVLEFRILAERDRSTGTTIEAKEDFLRQPIATYTGNLASRGPRARAGEDYQWFRIANPVDFFNLRGPEELADFEAIKLRDNRIVEKYGESYYVLAHTNERYVMLHPKPGETSWSLSAAFPDRDPQTNRPAVRFVLDAAGGSMFYRLTEPNVGKLLCVLLDEEAITAPVLNNAIRDVGIITGDFSQEEVTMLVNTLEAGALPARLKPNPISIKSIGPSLGESNRQKGMQSAIYGLVVVLAFVALYYLVAGVIANVALLLNLLLVLAIMALLSATLTLPGIAGLILTVGMAIDANVLIFERMREEKSNGSTLRMIIKNGYDRAFSTIFDANVTTLITCIILGYVGSEEVKGFALTLGFGVCTSMFTALFVTRVIFMLLIKYNLIKSIPMLQFPGLNNLNVDWVRLYKVFWPISVVLVIAGIVAFDAQDRSSLYDIEFLGGTSAQVQLKESETLSDEGVRKLLADPQRGAPKFVADAAAAVRKAEVTSLGPRQFSLSAAGLNPAMLGMVVELSFDGSLGSRIARGTLAVRDKDVVFEVPDDVTMSVEQVREALAGHARYLEQASSRLAAARVQMISGLDLTGAGSEETSFEVVTLETDKKLVQEAILAALGERLKIDRALEFEVRKDAEKAETGAWPIPPEATLLSDVIGGDSAFDVQHYRGGAVIVLDDLTPPQPIESISKRLRDMRLQPDYEQYEWREFEVVGLTAAATSSPGAPVYSSVALVVVDENFLYEESPGDWDANLAGPELRLTQAALSAEQSLQKVLQFAPSVAGQARTQAFLAVGLAMIGIMSYLWFRFGSMQYGLAAVIALIHDVSIAVGLVALSTYLAPTILGKGLMIYDFRIDMTLVAAFLTVLGYSVNDTIVIFDRIRENRGKMKTVTAPVVNNSINQCMGRTLLTGVTTLLVVLVMYVFGGVGIHGFNYVMMIGVIIGTYSSVAIAAPILLYPHLMRIAVMGLAAFALIGVALAAAPSGTARLGAIAVIVVVALALMIRERLRWDQPIVTGAQ